MVIYEHMEQVRKEKCTKRYKSSNDEHRIKDVVLEGEQGQTHVGENEVLRQEIQQFKELKKKGKSSFQYKYEQTQMKNKTF